MSYSLDYYLRLPTGQYQNSPKFLSFLEAILQPLEDASSCADSLVDAFDIDEAEGVQLDIIGKQVGASRTLSFQPSNEYSPILEDEDYRILLKATIGKNHWDGQAASLYALWMNLLPGGSIIIQDNQDMSFNVYLSGALSSIVIDMILHDLIVPRPEGVLINYYMGTWPLFGFDYHDDYIDGFDIGNWYTPTV